MTFGDPQDQAIALDGAFVRISERFLRAASVRPGVSVCAVHVDGVFAVVGCDVARQVRVECDSVPSSDSEIGRVVEHSLQALTDAGFLALNRREEDFARPRPQSGLATDFDDFRSLADDARRRGVVTFAGRCLNLPAGGSSFERRTALRRFLAGGQARVIAHCCLAGAGRLIQTEPPFKWRESPDGLAVFEAGEWTVAEVGGGVGALGTSRTLRTWRVGPAIVSTSACHFRLNSPSDTKPTIGGSVGVNAAVTEVPAVAEACERYLGGVVDSDRLREASMAELGDAAIDPRSIVDYAPWQYQKFNDIHPFTTGERRLWVDVVGKDGEPRAALADLVFYPFGKAGTRLHTSTNSSGMAAHTSLSAAKAGAVNELIERDAFMRLWLGRRRGRRLTGWRSVSYRPLVATLEDRGWNIEMLQVGSARCEPVLLATACQGARFAIGASAGDPHAAVNKAVFELWATIENESVRPEQSLDPDHVQSPAEHARFALTGQYPTRPEFLSEFDGAVAVEELLPQPTWPSDIYFYEWDKRLSRPFRVVRALAPSLIPISFGRGREPYGRPDVASLVGESLPRSLADCPPPHPFP